MTHNNLVGGWALPLWKMMEFVSWDDEIPNIWNITRGYFPINTSILVGEYPMNHHESPLSTTNHQPVILEFIVGPPSWFNPSRSIYPPTPWVKIVSHPPVCAEWDPMSCIYLYVYIYIYRYIDYLDVKIYTDCFYYSLYFVVVSVSMMCIRIRICIWIISICTCTYIANIIIYIYCKRIPISTVMAQLTVYKWTYNSYNSGYIMK